MSAVFVTGATGTVGSSVVSHLLERDQEVIAGVLDPHTTGDTPGAATQRRFDFSYSAAELKHALFGADRLFLMRPPAIADVRTYLFPVIDAALELGIKQIAFLSLQGVRGNRRTPHYEVESYLRHVNAPYTFLRPNFFMQNFSSTYAGPIRERNEIFVPAGRSRTAFIDARDIGKVAAAVLTSPGHIRKAYTLSGEQSLTYKQVARIMSSVLDRDITYPRPPESQYLAELELAGAQQDYIDVQKMIHRVVRMNVSAFPNRSIQRLTGTPATTFEQFVRDHKNVWGSD